MKYSYAHFELATEDEFGFVVSWPDIAYRPEFDQINLDDIVELDWPTNDGNPPRKCGDYRVMNIWVNTTVLGESIVVFEINPV